jgi:hypothetical protein
VALVGSPGRVEELSSLAVTASAEYAFDRFAEHLDAVIDDMEPAKS